MDQLNIFNKYSALIVLSLLLLFITLFVSGCAKDVRECTGSSPAADAQEQNRLIKTNSIGELLNTRGDFHDAALNQEFYSSESPFFLVGIEKPRANTSSPYPLENTISENNFVPVFNLSSFKIESDAGKAIENVLDDPRSLVLTHVLRAKRTQPEVEATLQDECFVYNIYKDDADVKWCNNHHEVDLNELGGAWSLEGWKALDLLGEELINTANDIEATHIILLVTGWNTVEYESFQDFDYWMKKIVNDFEGKQDFNPIFIGLTWESAWQSSFWKKLPFGSWSTKGNDADAIGYTWANYLLNDVLKPIAGELQIQLAAVGHSFGSRIVFGSHYVRGLIKRERSEFDSIPITLIGLQAAFPTGRFIKTKGRKHVYDSDHKDNATIVITTSSLDKATGTIGFGTGYIGGAGGMKELKKERNKYDSVITNPVILTDRFGHPSKKVDPLKVNVYDATPFVNCELQGTKSGSHSDVYDQEMGHFLGEILRD
jgi:hypothetical protein